MSFFRYLGAIQDPRPVKDCTQQGVQKLIVLLFPKKTRSGQSVELDYSQSTASQKRGSLVRTPSRVSLFYSPSFHEENRLVNRWFQDQMMKILLSPTEM